MVFRLVLDAIRRKWRMGALAVLQFYFVFRIPAQIWPSSDGMAWVLAGALFLAIQASQVFESRELFQLPVSRRAWWLARWWLAVAAPVVIAQLAGSFAQWSARSQWPSTDQIVLSMTFGVLYCGCGLALQATSVGQSGDAPATHFMSTVGYGTAMLGLIAAPFVFAPYLPHSFAEMTITSAVVIVALAALTVRGYLHEPAIESRPSQRAARREPSPGASSQGTAPVVGVVPTGFVDRLTGLRLVLWSESRKQAILFSSMIAVGVACWAVASRFRPVPALSEAFRLAAVLPFSSPRASIVEPMVFGALLVVATLAEPGLVANIRSLRTLPLSSARLSCLPVALGLVCAAMLWLVLLGLHGLVLWTMPVSPRVDLFVAVAALAASTHAIRFTAPGQAGTRATLAFVPVAVTWLALAFFSDSWRADVAQPVMLIGGLLALAASWVVMHRAVRRSSMMYRQRPVAAGGPFSGSF